MCKYNIIITFILGTTTMGGVQINEFDCKQIVIY